jgi:hypothetical protein
MTSPPDDRSQGPQGAQGPQGPASLRLFGGGFGAGAGSGGDGRGGRARGRVPIRFMVGTLGVLLALGSGVHIWPAIRAGLHDGTRGSWVATARTCVRSACTWRGTFVSHGHVLMTSVQYAGQVHGALHAGTTLPALYTGGSGLVFPAAGSDLWVSMLVGLLLGLAGLFWAVHRWVARFIREHRADQPMLAPLPRRLS